MGRYLSVGVMTRFQILKSNRYYYKNDFDIKKELDKILKEMDNFIDTSFYTLTKEYENGYVFSLKPEIFDKNIHELLREISSLTYPNSYGFDINDKDINDKNFINDYPYSCKVDSNGKYHIRIKSQEVNEDSPFYPMFWIINDDRIFRNVTISPEIILIWQDWDKYVGEDETNMLRIINNMKTKYYNSKLSKALVYYISG